MKIAFIPIDNRPVCYTLPLQISKIDKNLELLLPPRELLGGLTTKANVLGILDWLKQLDSFDKLIVSLDTIAYGGLVASRRCKDSYDDILKRLNSFKEIVSSKKCEVYACSSIMRISNNNINEEEKDYWNLYGEKIFKYSYEIHKNAPSQNVETDVPQEILQDYLTTRKRNFDVNKIYLTWINDGFLDTLVYSKDDCAQYGLNVAEAESLDNEIKNKKLNALVKTGADEIPLSLLSRAITKNCCLKIAPVFSEPDTIHLISKYEDVSVFESVKGQIELAGCCMSSFEDADIVLYVNNFKKEQGEIVMGVSTEPFDNILNLPKKPYLIADILNANGSDNIFVNELFEKTFNFNCFLGYAGWNTTGNTLGSALCCAIVKYLSKNTDICNFKKVQMIRFLDDWAYQANVRQKLKSNDIGLDTSVLKKEMVPYEEKLKSVFNLENLNIDYGYPWERFFEIEVTL